MKQSNFQWSPVNNHWPSYSQLLHRAPRGRCSPGCTGLHKESSEWSGSPSAPGPGGLLGGCSARRQPVKFEGKQPGVSWWLCRWSPLQSLHLLAHQCHPTRTERSKKHTSFEEAQSVNRISHLIEEHILPVGPFSCKLLDDPLWADAMFGTQLLPELKADCKQRR